MSMAVLFLGFCVLSIAGVPIYAGLGLSSILYLLVSNPDFLVMLPQRVWAGGRYLHDDRAASVHPRRRTHEPRRHHPAHHRLQPACRAPDQRRARRGLGRRQHGVRRHFRFVGGRHLGDRLGDDPRHGGEGLLQALRHRPRRRRLDHGHDHSAEHPDGDLFHGVRRLDRRPVHGRPGARRDDRPVPAGGAVLLQARPQAASSRTGDRVSPRLLEDGARGPAGSDHAAVDHRHHRVRGSRPRASRRRSPCSIRW